MMRFFRSACFGRGPWDSCRPTVSPTRLRVFDITPMSDPDRQDKKMRDWTLTKTRLAGGVWEGVLSGGTPGAAPPRIEVSHLQEPLDGVEVVACPGDEGWTLRVPVPADRIADGVQTFVIRDGESGEVLDSFALLAGEALSQDIRAEMALLREELDLLKQAFRRHCRETTDPGGADQID